MVLGVELREDGTAEGSFVEHFPASWEAVTDILFSRVVHVVTVWGI